MPKGFLSVAAALLSVPSGAEIVGGNTKWGDWVPANAGWKAVCDRREQQVLRIDNTQERYDAFLNLAVSGVLVPQYTEKGWAVIKTPENVQKRLHDALHAGFAKAAKKGGAAVEDMDHEDARNTFNKGDASDALGREMKIDQVGALGREPPAPTEMVGAGAGVSAGRPQCLRFSPSCRFRAISCRALCLSAR
jgi:hypothetical protein